LRFLYPHLKSWTVARSTFRCGYRKCSQTISDSLGAAILMAAIADAWPTPTSSEVRARVNDIGLCLVLVLVLRILILVAKVRLKLRRNAKME